jgi:hypothetical protein
MFRQGRVIRYIQEAVKAKIRSLLTPRSIELPVALLARRSRTLSPKHSREAPGNRPPTDCIIRRPQFTSLPRTCTRTSRARSIARSSRALALWRLIGLLGSIRRPPWVRLVSGRQHGLGRPCLAFRLSRRSLTSLRHPSDSTRGCGEPPAPNAHLGRARAQGRCRVNSYMPLISEGLNARL